MILSSALLYAEDIIITRSSEKISAFIEEVGPDYIKYHKKSDPKGPLFRLEAYEIATIIYGNGEVQTFDAPAPAANEPQQPQQPNGYAQQPQPQYGYGYQPYPQQPFVDYKAIERHRKDSIKAEKKAALKAKMAAIPHEHFLVANYAFTFDKTHNIGLTYGWCKVAGVYVNMMLGLNGFHYKADGHIEDRWDYMNSWYGGYGRQLTNHRSTQRISIVPGAMFRLANSVYLNFGVGYAFRSLTFQATNGDWIRLGHEGDQHNIAAQLGIVGKVRGCSLMASYSGFGLGKMSEEYYSGWHSEIMIGVGVALEGKKGGKK